MEDVLQPHMRVFLQYMCEWLMDGDTYHVFPHFDQHFAVVRTVDPALVPKMIGVMSKIANLPLNDGFDKDDVHLEDMGLSPAAINKLFKSKFYKGFLQARREASFEAVKKGVDWPAPVRKSRVSTLCATKGMDEPAMAELNFAKSMLESEEAVKFQFLMKMPASFSLLAQWFPADNAQMYRPLGCTDGKDIKAFATPEFVRAVMTAAALPESVDDSIPNPVVRSLLKDYRKLKVLAKTPASTNLIAGLFMEVSAHKLGLQQHEKALTSDLDKIDELTVKQLYEIVDHSSVRKGASTMPAKFPAFLWISMKRKSMETVKVTVSDVGGEVGQKSAPNTQEEVAGKSVDAIAEEIIEKKEEDAEKEIRVGDTVVLTNAKKKVHKGCKAEVVDIKPATGSKQATLQVKILEGAERNTILERPITAVSREEVPQVVPAAGKRQADSTASSASSPAKVHKTADENDEASDIISVFGKPPPVVD